MALTRDFKETVAARVQSDPAFAQALLDEAITLFIDGEPDTAKLILRDLVNATVGFESLAEAEAAVKAAETVAPRPMAPFGSNTALGISRSVQSAAIASSADANGPLVPSSADGLSPISTADKRESLVTQSMESLSSLLVRELTMARLFPRSPAETASVLRAYLENCVSIHSERD